MLVKSHHLSSCTEPIDGVFVLFSGHNDRAVITLCRFFDRFSIPFLIVCSSGMDALSRTDWSSASVLSRIDRALDVSLFDVVMQAVKSTFGANARPIYCPTTEFMNQFVLKERRALSQLGWTIMLPSAEIYHEVTNKVTSKDIVKRLAGIAAPTELPWADLKAPCVLKPIENISGNEVNYPRLCHTDSELKKALSEIDTQFWFAQSWVDGQSYYLCAYITSDGRNAHFWQQNLLQQPGGKSVVLARTISNPGMPVDPFLRELFAAGYRGPLMLEIIIDATGEFNFIEINPRFWGPLQLALSACPRILELFADDAGFVLTPENAVDEDRAVNTHWYAWSLGAQLPECKRYPALAAIEALHPLPELLELWDVYAAPDTKYLHDRH